MKLMDAPMDAKWVDVYSDGSYVGRASEFQDVNEFICTLYHLYGNDDMPIFTDDMVRTEYIRYMPRGYDGEFEDGAWMLRRTGGRGAMKVYVLGGDGAE